MFDFIHRCIMAGYTVPIDFTKHGWRQFAKLNTSLGTRYIRAFILKRDVAEYIAAHEAAGVKLDTACHEFALRRRRSSVAQEGSGHMAYHGCIPHGEEAAAFAAGVLLGRIRRGCNLPLVRLLTGWRQSDNSVG